MPCPHKKKKGNPGKHKRKKHTPITSEAQRKAMGVAYAAKKGKISPSKLKGPARQMYESMPKAELRRHLVEAGGKKLPKKKKKRSSGMKGRIRKAAKEL